MTLVWIVSLIVFAAIAVGVSIFGFRFYTRPTRILDQLSTSVSPRAFTLSRIDSTAARSSKMTEVLQWVGERIPADPNSASFTLRLLMAAGFRSPAAFPIYLSLRLFSAVVITLLISIGITFSSLSQFLKLAVMVGSAIFGFWLPTLILEILVERRQLALRTGLPDALDMLVVCVEAGISLDQALRMVSEELSITHPELCRDFRLISTEMRTGVARSQALRNFADRTMEPEIAKLVAILIQTDRFGTSLGDSLRTHADFMRVRRRQLAEEKAGKLSVQLIFPVFFCILPAILVLTVGPAALQIFTKLLPAMGG